jgi:hypothetical protein
VEMRQPQRRWALFEAGLRLRCIQQAYGVIPGNTGARKKRRILPRPLLLAQKPPEHAQFVNAGFAARQNGLFLPGIEFNSPTPDNDRLCAKALKPSRLQSEKNRVWDTSRQRVSSSLATRAGLDGLSLRA